MLRTGSTFESKCLHPQKPCPTRATTFDAQLANFEVCRGSAIVSWLYMEEHIRSVRIFDGLERTQRYTWVGIEAIVDEAFNGFHF
jgi:hypothetical protein